MIYFNSEDTKHEFYTKLSTDQQIAVNELHQALVTSGFKLTVTEVIVEVDGRLRLNFSLDESYK